MLPVSFLFIAATVFGQAKLVEKVTKKGNEIVIPYEKYVLPNGLTLIVHEDHSDPVCMWMLPIMWDLQEKRSANRALRISLNI